MRTRFSGENKLFIQKEAIQRNRSFCIIDDLLATGGTVNCVADIINSKGKKINGLSVVIELKDLNGKSKFNFPVESQVIY